jgi:hypothetical protein
MLGLNVGPTNCPYVQMLSAFGQTGSGRTPILSSKNLHGAALKPQGRGVARADRSFTTAHLKERLLVS